MWLCLPIGCQSQWCTSQNLHTASPARSEMNCISTNLSNCNLYEATGSDGWISLRSSCSVSEGSWQRTAANCSFTLTEQSLKHLWHYNYQRRHSSSSCKPFSTQQIASGEQLYSVRFKVLKTSVEWGEIWDVWRHTWGKWVSWIKKVIFWQVVSVALPLLSFQVVHASLNEELPEWM